MKNTFLSLKALSLFSLMLGAAGMQAQETGLKYCGQLGAMQELYAKHPGLQQHAIQVKQQQAANGASAQKTAAANYIIPVVFHIMHQYGTENITDAQVIDAVRILNNDYQLKNADTTFIVPSFQNLKANIGVEFRLAKLDPNGNCTNGITRTETPLTNIGSDDVKFNQWDPHKYLNVWVVKAMMSGAAGYAYYPSTADGWPAIDGIVILSQYVGSIGTGAVNTSRALTHEVGHWLDLEHTWGSTNNPGVACGDDGVGDTPDTKGWSACNLNGNVCTPGVIENVQNYMEYAYCSRMFTLGQKQRMIDALTSSIAQRNNLWSNANLLATGTDNTAFGSTTPCKPIADFKAQTKYACVGTTISLSDQSYNAQTSSWKWTLAGGTPTSAVMQNPTVTYNTPGTYPVKLRVANASGADSITKTSYIVIQPTTSPNPAPFIEGFETLSFPASSWIINSGGDAYTWEIANVGATGSKSMRIQNRNADEKDIDEIISPSFNLSSAANAMLSFKTAYAMRASDNTDELRVFISKDCGKTWNQRFVGGFAAIGTSTTTFVSGQYTPNASQWVSHSLVLPTLFIGSNTMIKFSFTCGDGNNIYVDDINISSTVSVDELTADDGTSLVVMPNPFNDFTTVKLDAVKAEPLRLELTDVLGKTVYSESALLNEGENKFTINKNGLSSGLYFLNLYRGNSKLTRKLIIQ